MFTKKARGFVPGPSCCSAHKGALKIRPWTGTHPGDRFEICPLTDHGQALAGIRRFTVAALAGDGWGQVLTNHHPSFVYELMRCRVHVRCQLGDLHGLSLVELFAPEPA